MTAQYWKDFAHARRAPKWQERTLGIGIGLGAGFIMGIVLAVIWRIGT